MEKICTSFSDCAQTVYGVLQWTVAIASVFGTVALLTWIVLMVLGKDRPK